MRSAALRQSCRRLGAVDSLVAKFVPKNAHIYTSPPSDVTGAVAQVMKVTLTRQDEFILQAEEATSLSCNTTDGSIGVMAGHEYEIAQLMPGLLEIATPKESYTFAVSGGFAHVHNTGDVHINTAECIDVAALDATRVQQSITDATTRSNSADPVEKAVAETELEMLKAIAEKVK
eukprot:NODE_5854_length_672_cov_134.493578_g5831_i0.p1 GENE.NODE_5854_length_672_cov_134.493578_g5831_i0~~NODE_5854_length_672_cov_134.493578_g5831_i0.p1  ORF type:complete len:175 (-),score=41.41 NODE_5854_length_672_cov_134.493578_g5831_i0:84-608(-)